MENDGVQFVVRNDNTIYNMMGDEEPSWMPPLYPHRWSVWIGTYGEFPQVAISLQRPKTVLADDIWVRRVAQGRWSEMWPLFLTYVNLMNRGETE